MISFLVARLRKGTFTQPRLIGLNIASLPLYRTHRSMQKENLQRAGRNFIIIQFFEHQELPRVVCARFDGKSKSEEPFRSFEFSSLELMEFSSFLFHKESSLEDARGIVLIRRQNGFLLFHGVNDSWRRPRTSSPSSCFEKCIKYWFSYDDLFIPCCSH